jgi:hypothetical protein
VRVSAEIWQGQYSLDESEDFAPGQSLGWQSLTSSSRVNLRLGVLTVCRRSGHEIRPEQRLNMAFSSYTQLSEFASFFMTFKIHVQKMTTTNRQAYRSVAYRLLGLSRRYRLNRITRPCLAESVSTIGQELYRSLLSPSGCKHWIHDSSELTVSDSWHMPNVPRS